MKKGSLVLMMLSIAFAVSCKKDNAAPAPAPAVPTDLSVSGTANCYIVSAPGSYMFKAVKGNSDTSVGTVAKAEVLWESYGTDATPSVGSLVAKVAVPDANPGVITFSTPETLENGNALIVAKDASGNILWSWHIWICKDYDAQATAQDYYNESGTMMDRNLGATSAVPGQASALGLLYQWGRKDPFLNSSSINQLTPAKATSDFRTVASSATTGTVEYVTQHPTTFVTDSRDWLHPQNDNLWKSPKTIYDPCPPGWQVPYEKDGQLIWLEAKKGKTKVCSFDKTVKGINFTGKLGEAASIWYPAAGYRRDNGSWDLVGNAGYWWSCSISGTDAASAQIDDEYYDDMAVLPSYRVFGQSVRCCKE